MSEQDRLAQAVELVKAGNYAEAQPIVAEVIRANRKNLRAWILMAKIVDDPQKALKCWEEVARLKPDDPSIQQEIALLKGETTPQTQSPVVEECSAKAQPENPSVGDEADLLEKARGQGRWIFGPLWFVVNTFGWGTHILLALASGWIVWQLYQYFSERSVFNPLGGEVNHTLVAMIVSGVCWGAIIGSLQLSILARCFGLEGKNWVTATIVGSTFYSVVQLLYSYFFQLFFIGFTVSFSLIGTFVRLAFSFVPPFVLGLAQWIVLRRYFARSGWWIIATTLALGLATSIASELWRLVPIGNPMGYRYDILFSSATFFIQGSLYSVATWIVLKVISRWPATAHVNVPDGKEEFNWMLPLLGAIGFWIGFALTNAVSSTIYDIARNAFAYAFPGTEVEPGLGIHRGIIVGGIGGAALGLAFKEKNTPSILRLLALLDLPLHLLSCSLSISMSGLQVQ